MPIYAPLETLEPRQIHRVVSQQRVWSIGSARTVRELLRVVDEVLSGYQALYNEGVAHGDLSLGNVVIVDGGPKKDDLENANETGDEDTIGQLVETHYMRHADSYKASRYCDQFQTPEVLTTAAAFHEWCKMDPGAPNYPSMDLSKVLTHAAMKNSGLTGKIRFFDILKNYLDIESRWEEYSQKNVDGEEKQVAREVGLEHVGIFVDELTNMAPDFPSAQITLPYRNGSWPFMPFKTLDSKSSATAICDMESFYYVLLYVSCAGLEKAKKTWKPSCYSNLFFNPSRTSMGNNKRMLIRYNDSSYTNKVDQDTCRCMEDFLDQWVAFIHLAYEDPSFAPFFYPVGALQRHVRDFLAKLPKPTVEEIKPAAAASNSTTKANCEQGTTTGETTVEQPQGSGDQGPAPTSDVVMEVDPQNNELNARETAGHPSTDINSSAPLPGIHKAEERLDLDTVANMDVNASNRIVAPKISQFWIDPLDEKTTVNSLDQVAPLGTDIELSSGPSTCAEATPSFVLVQLSPTPNIANKGDARRDEAAEAERKDDHERYTPQTLDHRAMCEDSDSMLVDPATPVQENLEVLSTVECPEMSKLSSRPTIRRLSEALDSAILSESEKGRPGGAKRQKLDPKD